MDGVVVRVVTASAAIMLHIVSSIFAQDKKLCQAQIFPSSPDIICNLAYHQVQDLVVSLLKKYTLMRRFYTVLYLEC